MDKELVEGLRKDISESEKKEIIVSCGKSFNALAIKGCEHNNSNSNRHITLIGNINAEELITLLQSMILNTYNQINQNSKLHLSDGIGNAFVFNGDTHELLGGLEINFEGKELSVSVHSKTTEPNLGQSPNLDSMFKR